MLYVKKHQERLINQMTNLEIAYTELIFNDICSVPAKLLICQEHYRNLPEGDFMPISKGETWGGEDQTGWFSCEFTVPPELDRQKLFISARVGAPESLLFVNHVPKGIFANKHLNNHGIGNHHCLMLTEKALSGETIHITLESYCWFNTVGTQPYEKTQTSSRISSYDGIYICTMNETIKDFAFNLRAINQLIRVTKDEYRKSELLEVLEHLAKEVYLTPLEHPMDKVIDKLEKLNPKLENFLNKNSQHIKGYVGLIGHSHMDTAWMWPIKETIRKCARTYSNALSLMDQYPEYTFVQSSAYHSELMRRHYPMIWERMKTRIAEGRYEPNGGAWVECDCNVPSGESIIRQFLWGQKFYAKHCDYMADTFWLPDTFGYSAALPQILNGCGIRYFTTTKLSWNDTNKFPYDTFIWRGNDGSEVITHFNATHCEPSLDVIVKAGTDWVENKSVSDGRLVSYGIGDGGGGPSYDWIEITRRAKNAEGCPKSEHTTVTQYMNRIEQNRHKLPLYSGELYLELHRGTLTSIHEIKRNNRLAEFSLRSLEMLHCLLGKDNTEIDDLYETVLVNQFHDILPGTSIPLVNDTTITEMREVLDTAKTRIGKALKDLAQEGVHMNLFNPLSWEHSDFYLENLGLQPKGAKSQYITNVFCENKLYIEEITLPPLSLTGFESEVISCEGESVFHWEKPVLSTPLYTVVFNEQMAIRSLILKSQNRELVRSNGLALNSFLIGQDVPYQWDNWDIEYETINKLSTDYLLIDQEVVADGALQFRLRNTYKIGTNSVLKQDIVFYAHKEQIDFETQVDWNEKHMLLKAGFDFNVLTDYAKHEIQFGFVERPTFKRNVFEQAMFEVSNHKYTDLSETNFGVAILNDCKYGISVEGTKVGLSLMKSGTHPDPRGDQGIHRMTYAILPHNGFGADAVVQPAYAMNTQIEAVYQTKKVDVCIAQIEKSNIVAEAIKPAYDGNGIIIRLYECEKTGTCSRVSIPNAKKIWVTNMLEENLEELDINKPLNFRAFEIKTLRAIF